MASGTAEFAIEIAATMGGAEKTTAELDALVTSFTGAGRGASAFQDALKTLSGQLDTARAAQEAANTALAAGQAEYSKLETAALQASKAAEKASASEGAISARAAKLAADALAAADAQRVLAAQLATVNDAISTSTDYLPPELIARADALTVALAKATTKTNELEAAATAAASAEQEAAARTLDAATAALKAQDVADKYAADLRVLETNAAGAAREEEHLAQTLGNVRKLGAHADKVIAKHAESLSKLGGALGAVGGPLGSLGQKLTAPVKGFSELAGVMGSTNAAAVLAAVGVAGLAAALFAAAGAAVYGLGKITIWAVKLADKEGRLAAQTDRLSTNFDELFSGLNIEPVIDGMTALADLFDRNTAAGETMALAFEGVFQPIVDNATAAAQAVEAFVLGFLIGATKLFIALKPVIKGIAEFFGFDDPSLALSFETIADVGEALAPVILGIVAAFAGAVAIVTLFVGGIALLVGALAALPAAIVHVGVSIVSGIVDAFTMAVNFIKSLDFVQLGIQMMQGLANGILSGAGAVVNAISGAVKGAIGAAKSLLGIASPSKVFADIGGFTGEGMAGGVEDSAAQVQGAMVDMVSPDAALAEADASVASIPSPVDAPSAAAPSSGGSSRDFSGATFIFQGVPGAEQAVQRIKEVLMMSEEELALSLGAGEATA